MWQYKLHTYFSGFKIVYLLESTFFVLFDSVSDSVDSVSDSVDSVSDSVDSVEHFLNTFLRVTPPCGQQQRAAAEYEWGGSGVIAGGDGRAEAGAV